ncbi:MAG: ABC transporter substrate-binding protein, partial [Defluviitaleaceae bacterium]|nr:ABC transporter substrate-binding protein [Defluviitaleaceae bacterium]
QASDIPRAEETDSVTLHRNMNFSYNYIGFNLFNPDSPTYDVRVRQAIAYALDLDAIVQHAFHGAGAPAQGPLTTSHQFFVPTEPFPFDLDRARELMAEAGYPDGFSVNFWVNEGNQMRFDAAVIVQNQLRQIDIDVNVEVLEWSSYLERTANAEHDMFILGWISGNPDPDTGLWMVFHGINSGLPGNRSFFDHPEANELLERGRGEVDDAVRAEIYARIQHIIRDEAPHIFMWEGEELIVSTPAVQNFFANPTGSPWFWEVYFAE